MKKLFSALKKSFSLSSSLQPDTDFAVDVPPSPAARLTVTNGDPENESGAEPTPDLPTSAQEKRVESQGFEALIDGSITESNALRESAVFGEPSPEVVGEPEEKVISRHESDTNKALDENVDNLKGNVVMIPKDSSSGRVIKKTHDAIEAGEFEEIGGRPVRVISRHPTSGLPTKFEYLDKPEHPKATRPEKAAPSDVSGNLRAAGEILTEQGGAADLNVDKSKPPASATEDDIAAKMDEAAARTSPATKEPVVDEEEVEGSGQKTIGAEGDKAANEELLRRVREIQDATAKTKAEPALPRTGRGQTVHKGGANKPFGERPERQGPAQKKLLDMQAELAEKKAELELAKDTARPLEVARLEEEIGSLERKVSDRERRRDEMNKVIRGRRDSRIKNTKTEKEKRTRMVETAKRARQKQGSERGEVSRGRYEAPREQKDRIELFSSKQLEKQLRKREKEVSSVEALRQKAFDQMKDRQRDLEESQGKAELYKNALIRGPLFKWVTKVSEGDLERQQRQLVDAERNLRDQVENRNRVVLVLENRLRDQLVEPERRTEEVRTKFESAESLFDTMRQTLGVLEAQLNNLEDAASDPQRHAELMDRSWREQVERIRGQVLEQRVQLREFETNVLQLRARLAKEQAKVDEVKEQIVMYVRRSRIPEALDIQTAPTRRAQPVPPIPVLSEGPTESTPAEVELSGPSVPEDEDLDFEDKEDEEDEEPSEPQYGVERFVEVNNTYFRTKDGQTNAPEIDPQNFTAKLEEVQQRRQHEVDPDNATAEDLVDALGLMYKAAGAEATPEFWEGLKKEVEGNELINPVS